MNSQIEMNEAILVAYIDGTLSPEQMAQVEHWYDASEENRKLFEQLYFILQLHDRTQSVKGISAEQSLAALKEKIAGINHMGWLLELYDADGNDLYPEIRRRAAEALNEGKYSAQNDLVRLEYVRRFGYYCTESSEHNAEYNPFYIKKNYPELIDRYNIKVT